MIKIEIDSKSLDERSGTSAKGKPYLIREQVGYAHILNEDGKPGKYPVRCKIGLEEKQNAYEPGFYSIDPRCMIVGDFDRVAIGRLRLIPAAK
ncbi:MAG: single-stranded DNA-binding protein [Burkholderiales bacterium]